MSKLTQLIIITLFMASLASAQTSDIELANRSILIAKDAIQRMDAAGFSTINVEQTLIQAENAFDSSMYGQTLQISNSINDTANNAFRIYALIDEAQKEIDANSAKGFDISDASDLIDVARTSFEMENYGETERFVNKAKLANTAAGPGRNLYLLVAYIFGILIIITILFYYFIYPKLLMKRLKTLKEEETAIQSQMRGVVQRYYESDITRDEFEKMTKVSEYQLADLQGRIAYLESRLTKREKVKRE